MKNTNYIVTLYNGYEEPFNAQINENQKKLLDWLYENDLLIGACHYATEGIADLTS